MRHDVYVALACGVCVAGWSCRVDGVGVPQVDAMSRSKHLPEIIRLREQEGLLFREIAERLGLSRSTAHGYYTDQDGAKEWARKHSARCAVCDTPVNTSSADWGGLCGPCRRADPTSRRELGIARRQNVYTDEQLVAAVRALADDLGRTPTNYEYEAWAKGKQGVPSLPTVTGRIGWNNAVERAGLPLNATYRKRGDVVITDEYLIDNLREFAASYPDCKHRDYEVWAKANGRPASRTVRLRFGGWFDALDAAGVSPREIAA